jgi:sortase A
MTISVIAMFSRSTRPPLSRFLNGLGKTLISTGVLLLLFTCYQLWGTGLNEQLAQKRLEKNFEIRRAPTPQYSIPKTGDVAGRITIDAIEISKMLVVGVDYKNLERGPGIFPGSPLPGHLGNLAIAGHRATFGAPFARLNELQIGDSIEIESAEGTFTYVVNSSPRIVAPTAIEVAQTLDPSKTSLTLITCHPKWSSKNRLIVQAEATTPPAAKPSSRFLANDDGTNKLTQGWFEDSEAWPVVYGLLGALLSIALACRLLVRRFRRKFIVYTASLLVFLPTLFVFYSQVSRLLPSNL